MSAHDRWLTQYRTGHENVWCSNPKCDLHLNRVEVRWESENGQSWWTPEDCFQCGHAWLQDKPEEPDV